MSSLSFFVYGSAKYLSNKKGDERNKQQPNFLTPTIKKDAAAGSVSNIEKYHVMDPENRRNSPTKLQLVDPFRQGVIIQEELCYRQTIVVRSFEVGPDETMTMESILNLLRDTATNNELMSGHCAVGSVVTRGMMRNNLIWVITSMHVQMDCHPIWAVKWRHKKKCRFTLVINHDELLTRGEVIDIDTWMRASGKGSVHKDWLIKSHSTGHIYARATSKWVMMNQETRRFSRIPDEVMAGELSPWFSEKQAIETDKQERIQRLDQNPEHVLSGLKTKWFELDMNQHVNNVKYARWMLEAIPDIFLKNHQLSEIIMEYKRECRISDVVQSLCHPHEGGINDFKSQHGSKSNGQQESFHAGYTHLLQTQGESKTEEIARGITKWKIRVQSAIRAEKKFND